MFIKSIRDLKCYSGVGFCLEFCLEFCRTKYQINKRHNEDDRKMKFNKIMPSGLITFTDSWK